MDARLVVPVLAVVLLLGATFGPRYGPFLRLYADFVRPRLPPSGQLEDPCPPRFAAVVGGVRVPERRGGAAYLKAGSSAS